MLEVMRGILQSRYLRSNVAHKQLAQTFLRAVPTNSKAFLRGCMDMREKQISTSVIKIQKEKRG